MPARRSVAKHLVRALALGVLALGTLACSTEAARQRHLADGKRYFAEHQYNEAIVAFRNAVAIDENSGEARFELAEAYAASGEPERAYQEYLRAADLLPEDVNAQLKAASFLLLAKSYEDARARAERALQLDPQNVDAQIIVANALAGARDLEGAMTQIREAIAVDPSRSQVYTSLARLHVAGGQHEEAMKAYQKALQLAPQSVAAHLALANYQWSRGESAAAEELLKKAYAIDPRHVLTNRVLATFYMAADRASDAERHLKFLAESTGSTEDRFALVDFYLTHERLDEARALLEPLAARATTRGAAETRLARVEYLGGDPAAANARLERVLAREPNYASALVLRAERAARDRNWEEALWSANAAIAANPSLLTAYYVRAESEMRTHRLADAMKSYSTVLSLNPEAADAKVALSRLHLVRNQVDSAVLYAEEALRNAPDDVGARLALIRAWLVRGDESLATRELQRVMDNAPPSAEAYVLAGELAARRGEVPAARRAYERALDLEPTTLEALASLTAMDVRAGGISVARTRIDAALAQEADDTDLLTLAAKVALAGRDLPRAEELLRRVIALDTRQVTAFALLAHLFQLQHRLPAAVEEFDALARREPARLHARLMAAVAVHTAGDTVEAERRYQEILKRDPRTGLAANNLASIYIEQGLNLAYAEQLATVAAEELPTEGEVLDTLGMAYYKRALFAPAVRSYQQAVAIDPSNPVFHYHLGQAHAGAGDPNRARDSYQAALRLNPRLTGAREALASLPQ